MAKFNLANYLNLYYEFRSNHHFLCRLNSNFSIAAIWPKHPLDTPNVCTHCVYLKTGGLAVWTSSSASDSLLWVIRFTWPTDPAGFNGPYKNEAIYSCNQLCKRSSPWNPNREHSHRAPCKFVHVCNKLLVCYLQSYKNYILLQFGLRRWQTEHAVHCMAQCTRYVLPTMHGCHGIL